MKELLITLKTAKLAKEKGFNLPTEYYYYTGEEKYNTKKGINKSRLLNRNVYAFQCTAPRQSLLQKWLRTKMQLWVHPNIIASMESWSYTIYKYDNGVITHKLIEQSSKIGLSFEEATEEMLQEALKLI